MPLIQQSDWLDLVLNLTLLIALTILSDFVENRVPKTRRAGRLLQGGLFGATAVVAMLRPLDLGPGLIFDGRSVMVSLCSLYFGPEASALAALMAVSYRVRIGGVGLLMGSLVVLSSAGIGLLWRRSFRPDDRPPTTLQLYVFGLLVHAAMLALMATLPSGTGIEVLRRIGLPVMFLYPLATILAGKILSDHIEARQMLAALRQSEERFALSMEATKDGLWDMDVPTGRTYYSPGYYHLLGYEPGEIPTTNDAWIQALHPDDAERVLKMDQACIDGKTDSIDNEYRLRTKDGSWKWVRARAKCVERDEQGRALRLVGTHVDISDRKETEDRLRRNLSEKEILLREIHHRVKNNLNIISSLLNLQAAAVRTPEEAVASYRNSCERIIAMSLVHEKLYTSLDYADVEMDAYLDDLTERLIQGYGLEDKVLVERDAGGVRLDVNAAIPCGLILNELVTNAIKYAFTDGRPGRIGVFLRKAPNGDVELGVCDNGVGVPKELLEATKRDDGPLGLTLVRLLVDQLNGTMEITVDGGTAFLIRFPRKPTA